MTGVVPFSAAHRRYVMYLYRTALRSSRDWYLDQDAYRQRAVEIRVHFERNKDVVEPRALKKVLAQTEKMVADMAHPDPYRPPKFPGGVEWERNIPPPMFSKEQQAAHREYLVDQGVLPEHQRHA